MAPKHLRYYALDIISGMTAPTYVVQKQVPVTTTIAESLVSGTCMSIDPSTKLAVKGVGVNNRMPMWTWDSGTDATHFNTGFDDPASDIDAIGRWLSRNSTTNPTQNTTFTMIPAIHSCELVTTEFDRDNLTTNLWNTLLKSPTSTGLAGKLASGTLGTDCIVGVVSATEPISTVSSVDSAISSGYGQSVLSFWPVMFPVYP